MSKKGFITNKSLFKFSLFFIVLSVLDFITTNYALSHKIGKEGNSIIVNMVSNPYIFILIKVIGISVILMILSKIYSQNKPAANFAIKFICMMMLLVVGNNLLVINANAVVFSAFSGTSGKIGNGNGYFDNELSQYNLTVQRNIFAVTESTGIYLVDPIGYPLGENGVYQIVYRGDSNLIYSTIASDGRLYYVDSSGIKQKKSRSNTNPVLANSTGVSGNSNIITTDVPARLYPIGGYIYYLSGSTLKYFDLVSLQVSTYGSGVVPATSLEDLYQVFLGSDAHIDVFTTHLTGSSQPSGWAGGSIWYYLTNATGNNYNLYHTTESFCPSGCAASVYSGTSFVSINKVYSVYTTTQSGYGEIGDSMMNITGNPMPINPAYFATPPCNGYCMYLGGYTTTVLYAASTTTYNVFNFIEPGILNSPTIPAVLTYSLDTINSVYPTYNNNSVFDINFRVSYTANRTQVPIYTHRVDVYAPDGGVIGNYPLARTCESIGVLDWLLYPNKQYQCVATAKPILIITNFIDSESTIVEASNLQFSSVNPWINGTYTVKLIELPTNAILDMDSFTVLNSSGQLITSTTPTPSITTGTAPMTVGLVDGLVSILGLGVNSVSKLLFALIIIALAMLAGFIATKNQVFGGVILGLIPYLFFTFIEYLPPWGVVILGIVVAIKIGLFR